MDLGSPITIIGMAVVLILILIFDKAIDGAFSGLVKAMFTGWLNWVVILIVLALIILSNGGF